jgi:hypothetical protein
MTFQSGQDVAVRQAFLSNGSLAGTQDTSYRAISDNWPVFAYANDLGNVGSTPVATLYTIVHSQQRAIYFNGASGLVGVPSLWTSYWSNDLAAVCSPLKQLRSIANISRLRTSMAIGLLRMVPWMPNLLQILWLLADKIT